MALSVLCAVVHAVPALAAPLLPYSFNATAYPARVLPTSELPYCSSSPLPLVDSGVHDAQGVLMTVRGGELYDHPGMAACYGLWNLDSYRLTGKLFYLKRAEVQAERVVASRTVAADGAWFFPNVYVRGRAGDVHLQLTPPWYSALAQGWALSLFSRLDQRTGGALWRAAADATFLSFLRLTPADGGPSILTVDSDGYLWLQEWPWAGMTPVGSLNGHIFSAFGLYDYYQLTGDLRALALFQGAATSVEHYASQYRVPGWACRYGSGTPGSVHYQPIVVQQFLELYGMTGDVSFAQDADELESDYPAPAVSGSIVVAPGTYRLLDFALPGTPSRTLAVRRLTRFTVTKRIRHRGHAPIYFLISSGALRGYSIPEQPPLVYLPGVVAPLRYDLPRTVTLAAGGTFTLRRIGPEGRVLVSSQVSGTTAPTLEADRGAVVNGVPSVRICSRPYVHYWLALQTGVSVQ